MMDGITLTWRFRSLRPCLGTKMSRNSQQQNAWVTISMQGVGSVAIDGPRLEPGSNVSQGGLARSFVFISCWVAKLG